MAKYLVTGVAGFIGSNIAHALVERGEEVRGVDNFSHGRRENIAGILDRFDFRDADITDLDAMSSACAGMDFVLHQAALGSVPRSIATPLASNHANVVGTLTMLQAAREAGVKRVVYASSSSIYGDTPVLPKHEAMPANPLSPYAVSKLTGELYAQSFKKVLSVETVCLRYFNVFGPRQHPTSQYAAVIPIFIRSMLAGEQPTIFGDGTQSRDFTFIENVVSANLLACHAPAGQASGRVFNIAAGKNFSLNTVYALLQELTGFTKAAHYAPARSGDVHDSLADTTQAQQAIGYKTLVEFKEGLRQTVEWYRQNEPNTK
ncbi:MAG TPA: SDR family oxidoreductase [Candidatus Saccharimonadales bacterium]|jgi:nucleoside-diphosphate-sugar epimerase|nr:SDR family oxidoreductase [Candidatus Saccharimonadales bacterium]